MTRTFSYRFSFSAGLLSIVLGGCAAVGPDYAQPVLDHPQRWSTALSGNGSGDAQPLSEWWQSFNDPLLDKLVRAAMEGNADLAIARQRLRFARAQRDQVASHLGPNVGVSAEASASRSARALDYPPGIGEARSYQLGLDASWEIDIFGGNRRATEAAEATTQAVEADERAVRISLLAELATTYATLRVTQQRRVIAQDNVASLLAAEQLAAKVYRHGLGTTAEVAQARAERELAEARLPELLGDEERLVHAIGLLTGGYPGALKAALANQQPALMDPPSLPVGTPSEVVRNRPDIRAAERRLAAANAQIGVATAEQFPKFVIPLSVGSAASLVHDLFSDASAVWSLGAHASQSLYDGGRAKAGVRAAEAYAAQQRLAYEQNVRQAFRDVEDALVGLNAERSRQVSLSAAVQDSQIALDRASRLYRNGLSGYLSVLTAQRAVFQARDTLALGRLAHTRHVIGLYKALGAGWKSASSDAR